MNGWLCIIKRRVETHDLLDRFSLASATNSRLVKAYGASQEYMEIPMMLETHADFTASFSSSAPKLDDRRWYLTS